MVNEIEEIQRRAGMTTNWSPDDVSRAVKRMEVDLQNVFEQFTHIEGAENERRAAIEQIRGMMSNLTQLKNILKGLR